MVTVLLQNNLIVTGLPKALEDWFETCCKYNTVAFQSFEIPANLDLFERLDSNTISVPRGYLDIVQSLCKNSGEELKLTYNTYSSLIKTSYIINPELNYTSGIFKYQERITNELLNFNTVRLQAPAGVGKTAMSCIMAYKENKFPILFLANKERLLKQFIVTAARVFQISEDEIGIIKAKKYDIKPITAGSLQTLSKDRFDLEEIKHTFHTVFFDECHLSTALTYRKVLLGLAPQRLIGLSATPEHYSSNDLNNLMHGLLGPIGVQVQENEIPQRLTPKIFSRETGFSFPYKADSRSPEWMKHKCRNKLYNLIATHEERNKLIIKDCISGVEAGHKVLITVGRISQGRILSKMLQDLGIKHSFPYTIKESENDDEVDSKVNHKQLDEEVLEIERGNIDVLIGTYSLFQTGFDCRALSVLLLASPFSGINSTTIIQTIGRIQRHFFNKNKALVVDYIDDSAPNNVLRKWADDRIDTMKNVFKNHTLL